VLAADEHDSHVMNGHVGGKGVEEEEREKTAEETVSIVNVVERM